MIKKIYVPVFRTLKQGYQAMNAEKLAITDLRETLPWNPRRGKWKKRELSIIDGITTHQSAGHAKAASSPDIKCYNTEAVNNYHISKNCHISLGRGAPRICYTYAIEPNGELKWCNDWDDIVFHAGGFYNTTKLGIVVLGNFSGAGWKGDQDPTTYQLKTLEQIWGYLLLAKELPNLTKRSQVEGHCEIKSTKPACPGFVIMDYLKQWRGN